MARQQYSVVRGDGQVLGVAAERVELFVPLSDADARLPALLLPAGHVHDDVVHAAPAQGETAAQEDALNANSDNLFAVETRTSLSTLIKSFLDNPNLHPPHLPSLNLHAAGV